MAVQAIIETSEHDADPVGESRQAYATTLLSSVNDQK
jgi:hypothetical protein